MPAGVHHATAARHKGLGGRAPACTEFKAGILAPGPRTPGTNGESRATSGPTRCWGFCEENAFVKSNHWATYLRRGEKGGGAAREETDFITKVLVTITFHPLYNLGLPSCSTASEKAEGGREGIPPGGNRLILNYETSFPELASSPTLPPAADTPRNAGTTLFNESRQLS